MQFLYRPLLQELTNIGISRICCHALKDSPGNCMRNCSAPVWRRRRGLQDPSDQAPRNLLHLRGRSCPGARRLGRPMLQTSSNRSIFNRSIRGPVTNVVKPSPKHPISGEIAGGLTTFVTITQEDAQKVAQIDDVCNTKQLTGMNSQASEQDAAT